MRPRREQQTGWRTRCSSATAAAQSPSAPAVARVAIAQLAGPPAVAGQSSQLRLCLVAGEPVSGARAVKNRVVSHQAGPKNAAIEDAHFGGVGRGHLADGLLESQHFLLADVAPQHARERTVVARMWMSRGERALGGDRRAIRADRNK